MRDGFFGAIQLGYLGLREVFSPRAFRRPMVSAFLNQIYFSGYQSLNLVFALAFILGNLVIISLSTQLSGVVPFEVALPFIRKFAIEELAPFLIGALVIARSGTAVATEIGNMKANQEVAALESMGVSVLSYLVFPRLLSGLISVCILSLYFVLSFFLMGALGVMLFSNELVSEYLSIVLFSAQAKEVLFCLLKCLFSGFFIFVISCQEGFRVGASFHEVPQAASRAVMRSLIVVIGINAVLTLISLTI